MSAKFQTFLNFRVAELPLLYSTYFFIRSPNNLSQIEHRILVRYSLDSITVNLCNPIKHCSSISDKRAADTLTHDDYNKYARNLLESHVNLWTCWNTGHTSISRRRTGVSLFTIDGRLHGAQRIACLSGVITRRVNVISARCTLSVPRRLRHCYVSVLD